MQKTVSLISVLILFLSACSMVDFPWNGNTDPVVPTSTPCPPGETCGAAETETQAALLTQAVSVFAEEFNSDILPAPFRALPIWYDTPRGTDENVNAEALWVPESAFVSDGYLHLRAEKLPSPVEGRAYSSGYVQTGGYAYDESIPSQWFKYGYFEARMKFPEVDGTWPAFWLWADPRSFREIDIVEILLRKPKVTYHTLHNDGELFQVARDHPDPMTHWHTYAVDWQPGLIVWYVDRVEVGRFEDVDNIFDQEMYLVLSYQLGGDWAGPVDESLLPAEMLVDYVRVWSHMP